MNAVNGGNTQEVEGMTLATGMGDTSGVVVTSQWQPSTPLMYGADR